MFLIRTTWKKDIDTIPSMVITTLTIVWKIFSFGRISLPYYSIQTIYVLAIVVTTYMPGLAPYIDMTHATRDQRNCRNEIIDWIVCLPNENLSSQSIGISSSASWFPRTKFNSPFNRHSTMSYDKLIIKSLIIVGVDMDNFILLWQVGWAMGRCSWSDTRDFIVFFYNFPQTLSHRNEPSLVALCCCMTFFVQCFSMQ